MEKSSDQDLLQNKHYITIENVKDTLFRIFFTVARVLKLHDDRRNAFFFLASYVVNKQQRSWINSLWHFSQFSKTYNPLKKLHFIFSK